MKLVHLIILIFYLYDGVITYYTDRITPQTDEEKQQIDKLRTQIERMDESKFYNYHLMCSSYNNDTRVNVKDLLIHRTVPQKYYDLITRTLQDSSIRKDKCPKWTNGAQTRPKSGDMRQLTIEESAQPGQVLYLLSASDPERKPIFYFIRKSEAEQNSFPNDEIIFSLNHIKMGTNWYAEVRLNKKLNSNVKSSYTYLVNAFDGKNIIEKLSEIQVVESDPEADHGFGNYHQYYHHYAIDKEDTKNTQEIDAQQSDQLETVTKPNFKDPMDGRLRSSLLFLIDKISNHSKNAHPHVKPPSDQNILAVNNYRDIFKILILIFLLVISLVTFYFFVLF